jgi:hypothetical protein
METLVTILLFINMLFVSEAPLTDQAMHDFALEMEPYYAQSGIPTDTSNTSLHELPYSYWGATLWQQRCTNRVYLNERFASSSHPFYNTPMWKYILAHEWAHVAQGKQCWENESEAQLIALELLAEAGEWDAVYTALEWMLTLSAPDEVVTQLQIPPQEVQYYQVVDFTQLEAVEMLLNDEDGIFQLRTGEFDARTLWTYLQHLSAMLGDPEFEGPR